MQYQYYLPINCTTSCFHNDTNTQTEDIHISNNTQSVSLTHTQTYTMWQRRAGICFLLPHFPLFLILSLFFKLFLNEPFISLCPDFLWLFTSSLAEHRARHQPRRVSSSIPSVGTFLVSPSSILHPPSSALSLSILSAVCSLRNENQLSGRVLDKQQHHANAHIQYTTYAHTCWHDAHTHKHTYKSGVVPLCACRRLYHLFIRMRFGGLTDRSLT